jgi:photosystem II stability/assembly factor-like uncharacterized protein
MFYSFSFCQDYWESIFSYEENIHCLAINSIGYLFTGTSNGVFRSVDNGISWDQVLYVNYTKGIAINSQDQIFASPAPLYLSTSNGNYWDQLNLYYLYDVKNITVDTEDNIFVGFWGGICKSSDNGTNWELVLSLSDCEVVNSIVENSEGVLFAGTINFIAEGGGVYLSTDQGDSWEHIGLENEYISSLAINSNDEIFAGSRGNHYEGIGGVFRSSDNGETWTELCDDALVTSIAIDSEDKIFIGCSFLYYGAVWVSEDNGENWQLIESDLIDIYTSIEFLLISEDNYVYAISYENINHIYRSVQPTGGIHDYTIQEIKNIKLNNYPNPFNPSTTISFQFSNDPGMHQGRQNQSQLYNGAGKNELTELVIYNLKGQKVKTFDVTLLAKPTCLGVSGSCRRRLKLGEGWSGVEGCQGTVTWNGTDDNNKPVSSGIYFYKLKVGDFQKVRKMILLR